MNTKEIVRSIPSLRGLGIGFVIAGLMALAVLLPVGKAADQQAQGTEMGHVATLVPASSASTCPLDPVFQFWFPSPDTCRDKPVAERPAGMWCDDDGSRNELLRAWLDEKGVVGYGRWAEESRSNHSSSGFRPGYYYQVTDIEGGAPKVTAQEITAFLVGVFGKNKESPYIYLLTMVPTVPPITNVDVGSVYLQETPTLRENICRLAAKKGTEIKLQCDAPSGAAKK